MLVSKISGIQFPMILKFGTAKSINTYSKAAKSLNVN